MNRLRQRIRIKTIIATKTKDPAPHPATIITMPEVRTLDEELSFGGVLVTGVTDVDGSSSVAVRTSSGIAATHETWLGSTHMTTKQLIHILEVTPVSSPDPHSSSLPIPSGINTSPQWVGMYICSYTQSHMVFITVHIYSPGFSHVEVTTAK